MQSEILTLKAGAPGQRYSLQVLRFGAAQAEPKAYIQAAVHADELPALLVAHKLKEQLLALEAQGQVVGQVVLVPYANPIGLAQQVLGHLLGRFDVRDGVNFNREYADLAALVAPGLADKLGDQPRANTRLIRQALREATAGQTAHTPAEDLKNHLLRLAADADVVLDLHCDTESVLHLYALSPQAELARELGALLGARAMLLAEESGGTPFDEACSRPWLQLRQRFPQFPIKLDCFSTTVELRGETDVRHDVAEQDARGLLNFLRLRGVLAGPKPALPAPLCEPTPLAASEPIVAPHAGVVVFHRSVGERVAAGDLIADLLDPETGALTPLRCQSAGVLYAGVASRWAPPGKTIAKVAGTTLSRSGKLLGP
jgi:predicted deacylase